MSTRRRPPLAVLPMAIAVIQVVCTHLAAIALRLAGPALLRRSLPGPMAAAGAGVALGYLASGIPMGPFALSLIIALVLALVAGAR